MILKKLKKSLKSFLQIFLTRDFWIYFSSSLLLAFSIIFFAYHLAYARKTIPGVRMLGLDLSNKSERQTLSLLKPRLVELESANLQFSYQDKVFSKSMYEWGVRYDATSSAQKAFAFGRSGHVFKTTKDKFQAGTAGVSLLPVASIDEQSFSATLSEVAADVGKPKENPYFALVEGSLEVVPGESGYEIDENSFQELILRAAQELDFSQKELPIEEVEPDYTKADLENLEVEVAELLVSSPKLTFGSRTWTLSEQEILKLLDFEVAPENPNKIQITTNEEGLSSFVSSLAASINQPMRGGTFELQDGRVIDFALPQPGYHLKEEEAKQVVSEVVLDLEKSEVELPVEVKDVQANANQYGIRSLLGTGSSNFSGSSLGRIHNIDLASSRLDGILIPPGETFSFNETLGDVSSETGYKTSYVIKDGRTILGVGGGVCQVSTTMFRAALNAGLPIVERAAHAYRVHYYEQDKGPGFDATVYSPSPDVKFENDTPAHVLIKRYYNPSTSTLQFSFYGTSDGRTVNIVGPIIHSQTPPPEPEYIEDESLEPGETKQVDWAAWGARVTVKRKVTRGGEVLHEDNFYSSYQPWRAVYLVGKE
ncbi:MAG: VanW family protein [Patescibacteria group bacterium]|nr:VanW family protein [Patescibacteria group bacterium]